MSYQEKSAAVSILTGAIIFAIFAIYVVQFYFQGRFESSEASTLVGTTSCLLVGASIFVGVAVQVSLRIIHSIATNDCEPTVSDERDHQIELKSMQVAFITFCFVFMGLMGLLAFEFLAPTMALLLTVSVLYLCGLMVDIGKLLQYRRGY